MKMCVTQTPSPCEKRRCKVIRYRSGNGCQCCIFFLRCCFSARALHDNGNASKKDDVNRTEKGKKTPKPEATNQRYHLAVDIYTPDALVVGFFFSCSFLPHFLPFVSVIIILQHWMCFHCDSHSTASNLLHFNYPLFVSSLSRRCTSRLYAHKHTACRDHSPFMK